jgi:hypothetical protein
MESDVLFATLPLCHFATFAQICLLFPSRSPSLMAAPIGGNSYLARVFPFNGFSTRWFIDVEIAGACVWQVFDNLLKFGGRRSGAAARERDGGAGGSWPRSREPNMMRCSDLRRPKWRYSMSDRPEFGACSLAAMQRGRHQGDQTRAVAAEISASMNRHTLVLLAMGNGSLSPPKFRLR